MPNTPAVAQIDCSGCDARAATLVFRKNGLSLYRCCSCGLVFAAEWPRLAQENSYDYYHARLDWPEERIHVPLNATRFQALLAELGRLAPSTRLLDVGCGLGEFVRVAARSGWEVTGIEFSPEAVAVDASIFHVSSWTSSPTTWTPPDSA